MKAKDRLKRDTPYFRRGGQVLMRYLLHIGTPIAGDYTRFFTHTRVISISEADEPFLIELAGAACVERDLKRDATRSITKVRRKLLNLEHGDSKRVDDRVHHLRNLAADVMYKNWVAVLTVVDALRLNPRQDDHNLEELIGSSLSRLLRGVVYSTAANSVVEYMIGEEIQELALVRNDTEGLYPVAGIAMTPNPPRLHRPALLMHKGRQSVIGSAEFKRRYPRIIDKFATIGRELERERATEKAVASRLIAIEVAIDDVYEPVPIAAVPLLTDLATMSALRAWIGAHAQYLAAQVAHPVDTARTVALQHIPTVVRDPDEAIRFRNAQRDHAEALVREHWSTTNRVARELLDCGAMSGERFASLCDSTLALTGGLNA